MPRSLRIYSCTGGVMSNINEYNCHYKHRLRIRIAKIDTQQNMLSDRNPQSVQAWLNNGSLN